MAQKNNNHWSKRPKKDVTYFFSSHFWKQDFNFDDSANSQSLVQMDKKDVADKENKAAREAAVKAFFESKNITGSNLAIAMRGARDEIAGIELDGDKIKDTKALDDLVAGEFAGLVVKTSKQGASTATPPANNGGANLTKADIFKKDDHGRYVMSTAERQKALAENPELMKG